MTFLGIQRWKEESLYDAAIEARRSDEMMLSCSSHGAWRFVATEFSKSDKNVEADDRVQERCALIMLIGAAYLRYEGVRSSVTLHWGPMREGTPGSDGSCVRTRVEGPMEPKKLACLGALSLNTRPITSRLFMTSTWRREFYPMRKRHCIQKEAWSRLIGRWECFLRMKEWLLWWRAWWMKEALFEGESVLLTIKF